MTPLWRIGSCLRERQRWVLIALLLVLHLTLLAGADRAAHSIITELGAVDTGGTGPNPYCRRTEDRDLTLPQDVLVTNPRRL